MKAGFVLKCLGPHTNKCAKNCGGKCAYQICIASTSQCYVLVNKGLHEHDNAEHTYTYCEENGDAVEKMCKDIPIQCIENGGRYVQTERNPERGCIYDTVNDCSSEFAHVTPPLCGFVYTNNVCWNHSSAFLKCTGFYGNDFRVTNGQEGAEGFTFAVFAEES